MEHDGNGHVIRNFYVDRLNSENVGLFGHLTSASVRRVGFAGPLTYVRGGSHKMQIGISQPLSEAHTTAFTMIFGQIRKAVTFGLREAGRYTAQWSNVDNWIGGIGWKPGSWDKVVKYSGQYDVSRSQNSILALYSWSSAPQIEYWIVESYGSSKPGCIPNRQNHGTYQSDGATYELISCRSPEVPPSISSVPEYQYFSVRNPPKSPGAVEGTVTIANHFDTWASMGLKVGQLEFMIFAVDAYESDGSIDITVAEEKPSEDCSELEDLPICNSATSGGSGEWWFLIISSLLLIRRKLPYRTPAKAA
jgi:hypothetical protein